MMLDWLVSRREGDPKAEDSGRLNDMCLVHDATMDLTEASRGVSFRQYCGKLATNTPVLDLTCHLSSSAKQYSMSKVPSMLRQN